MKVAALGDNCIDLYQNLNRYYCTGNSVDFAVHMQRLGIDTSIISVTGNDEYGREMRAKLEREGLDTSHLHTEDGQTAVSYMELIDKERVYGDYIEGVMEDAEFTEDDIAFAMEHDLIHTAFWGNAQAYLPELRDAGKKIAFDYADEYDDPLVKGTAPYVTYAFFSFEEDNDEVRTFLKEIAALGPDITVATFGEKGSLAWDGDAFHICGIHEADVVNTIGAGDSYIAGFMCGILRGSSIEEAMDLGAATAAKVVSVFGPWPEEEQ